MVKRGSKAGETADTIYECDYEVNCTPLYKAIELAEDEVDYAAILYFLETGKWSIELENGDGSSPEQQAKTWVSLFAAKDKSKVKWSQLPLHLAIVTGAPAQVIAGLVNLYPQSVRCRDDQCMLPLHLALRYEARDDVIAHLLMQFPEAVNALGKKRRTTVECALRASEKARGIMLDIFVSQTASRYTDRKREDIEKKYEVTSSALRTKTTELSAALDRLRELELKVVSLESENSSLKENESDLKEKSKILEQSLAETEIKYKDMVKKLESEKLIQEVDAERVVAEYRAALNAADASEKQARNEESKLKRELEDVQRRITEMSAPPDWDDLKQELEELRVFRLERTRTETKAAINALKLDLEKAIESSRNYDSTQKSDFKQEMKVLKKNLERLQRSETKAKTASELEALRAEVDTLRSGLKLRTEAKKMKKAMEADLKSAVGKPKEIEALNKVVVAHNASNLESKTAHELSAIKAEFEALKKTLKEQEFVAKTNKDIDELRASLENEAKNSNKKTKDEIAAMKKALDTLQANMKENKSTDEIIAIKREAESLREEFKKKEASSRIRLELAMQKKMSEAMLANANAKTQGDLLQIKKSLQHLEGKFVNGKNLEELTEVKEELIAVKQELREVERISKAQKELEALQKNLEKEIKNANHRAIEELQVMKKSLVTWNIDQMQSKRLKNSLENEIKKSNERAEEELRQVKQSIEAINMQKSESKSKMEWEDIRREMEKLKVQLKEKELAAAAETQKELYAVKQTIAGMNLESLEKNRRSEYDAIKSEMEALKEKMQQKDSEEQKLKQEIQDLKKNMPKANRKSSNYLSQIFSKSYASSKNATGIAAREFESTDNLVTILPPRLKKMQEEDRNENSNENTDDDDSSRGSFSHSRRRAKNKSKFSAVTPSFSKDLSLLEEMSNISIQSGDQKSVTSSAPRADIKQVVMDTANSRSEEKPEKQSEAPSPSSKSSADAGDEIREQADVAISQAPTRSGLSVSSSSSAVKGFFKRTNRKNKGEEELMQDTKEVKPAMLVRPNMSQPFVSPTGEVEMEILDE